MRDQELIPPPPQTQLKMSYTYPKKKHFEAKKNWIPNISISDKTYFYVCSDGMVSPEGQFTSWKRKKKEIWDVLQLNELGEEEEELYE